MLSLSDLYPKSLDNGWGLADFQGGGFGNVGAELGGKFCHVAGEERGLVTSAGDGDVGEAGVEQVGVNARIGVDEDGVGGEALGAMTGYGVAVDEMTMVSGVELDLTVVVEPGGDAAIRRRLTRLLPVRDWRRRAIYQGR